MVWDLVLTYRCSRLTFFSLFYWFNAWYRTKLAAPVLWEKGLGKSSPFGIKERRSHATQAIFNRSRSNHTESHLETLLRRISLAIETRRHARKLGHSPLLPNLGGRESNGHNNTPFQIRTFENWGILRGLKKSFIRGLKCAKMKKTEDWIFTEPKMQNIEQEN